MATTDFRRSVDTKVHWGTPERHLELVRKVGPIDLDPCSNTASQKRVMAQTAWFGPPKDGLALPWKPEIRSRGGLVFVNYPYGDHRWPVKMATETMIGTTIIGLMSASTGARWWYQWVVPHARAICFVHGRMQFIDCVAEADFNDHPYQLDFFGDPVPADTSRDSGATFDSAFVFMSRKRSPKKFISAFEQIGDIWLPNQSTRNQSMTS